ncbi:MAG: hypothetical protein AcusKO_45750 [Acuticoccus sp.]
MVSDGTLTDEARITISLTDLNEGPSLADVVLSADEDAAAARSSARWLGATPKAMH